MNLIKLDSLLKLGNYIENTSNNETIQFEGLYPEISGLRINNVDSFNNYSCNDKLEINLLSLFNNDENLNEDLIISNNNNFGYFIGIDNNCFTNKNSFSIHNNEDKTSISLIGKKRRIFNVVYPNSYFIFNKGGSNIRQLIEEILKNDKKKFVFSLKKKKKRIDCPDLIRKKIKTRFLKILKNQVNNKLELAGSKKFFTSLDQTYVCNISKKINREVLDLTFKEVFAEKSYKIKKKSNFILESNCDNISVLEYLEKNKKIMEESGFKFIKDMTFRQIYYEYLQSKEFEMEITNLKEKDKEKDKYIKDYIAKASNLINFFEN